MTGTLINIATVLLGGTLGLLVGARLPERLRQTVVAGLGLFTAAFGLKMFTRTQNEIIVLGSLLLGGLLGEWWRIEDRLSNLGVILEKRFAGSKGEAHSGSRFVRGFLTASGEAHSGSRFVRGFLTASGEAYSSSPFVRGFLTASGEAYSGSPFVRGFLTASLVFCVGPMTILGAIQDGLTGDYQLLAVKSVLDGFAALAFASTLGVGVLFSTLVILVYQGSLSLLAAQAEVLLTEPMMLEMTAVGGVILIGIAVSSLLEIKRIRVGNFLPALVIAPAIVAILKALNI